MNVRIHNILTGSRANGPGIRNTVWFQGCTLGCPGCFNPGTHDPGGGIMMTTEEVCGRLLAPEHPCGGITISGGEPFQQPEALFSLLAELHEKDAPPVLIFSGYTFEEIMESLIRKSCAELADALICGPYMRHSGSDHRHYLASRNQKLILMGDRIKESDFTDIPLQEYIIDAEGNLIISGIIS